MTLQEFEKTIEDTKILPIFNDSQVALENIKDINSRIEKIKESLERILK